MREELENLLDILKKTLYIEYEYEESPILPRTFTSSFNLIPSNLIQNISNDSKIEFTDNSLPIQRFHYELLNRLPNGQYYYTPWKKQYQSLFECLIDLQKHYDLEELLLAFKWQDFETFIMQSFDYYGYISFRTFRFTVDKKRHEIDIIGRDGNKIFFIDAKHWALKTAAQSALFRVAQEQQTRIKHLIKNKSLFELLLKRLHVSQKQSPGQEHTYKLYPLIIVSSNLSKNTIINGIPILSFFRFNEFLLNFGSLETTIKPIIYTFKNEIKEPLEKNLGILKPEFLK